MNGMITNSSAIVREQIEHGFIIIVVFSSFFNTSVSKSLN